MDVAPQRSPLSPLGGANAAAGAFSPQSAKSAKKTPGSASAMRELARAACEVEAAGAGAGASPLSEPAPTPAVERRARIVAPEDVAEDVAGDSDCEDASPAAPLQAPTGMDLDTPIANAAPECARAPVSAAAPVVSFMEQQMSAPHTLSAPIVREPAQPAWLHAKAWRALRWEDARTSAAAYAGVLLSLWAAHSALAVTTPTSVTAYACHAALYVLMARFVRSMLAAYVGATKDAKPVLSEHAVLNATQAAVRFVNGTVASLDGRDAGALLRASLALRAGAAAVSAFGVFGVLALAHTVLFAAHPLLMADRVHPQVAALRTHARALRKSAASSWSSLKHKKAATAVCVAGAWMSAGLQTRLYVAFLCCVALRGWQQRDTEGFAAMVDAANSSAPVRAMASAAKRVSLNPRRFSQLAAMLTPAKHIFTPARTPRVAGGNSINLD